MGFVKAFEITQISQLTKNITKPMGLVWLFAMLLFLATALLFVMKKENWPLLAMISVIISQVLILLYWQDAKYGTFANIIIFVVAIQAFAGQRFTKMIQEESGVLLQEISIEVPETLEMKDISGVPIIIQKWMLYSNVVGNDKVVSVRLKQKGEMRTKPESKWMSFTAQQYFDVSDPSFVWSTTVDANPLFTLKGRDKLKNGKGEMLIKLASIIPVAVEKPSEKINTGTMLRFLGEMCWFPSAALNKYVTWEQLDATSAKATLVLNGKSVSGVYTFSEEGKFIAFQADRYYGGGEDAKLEKWYIEAKAYKEFENFSLPYKCDVTWKLAEGDFNWLRVEITDMKYNTNKLYR